MSNNAPLLNDEEEEFSRTSEIVEIKGESCDALKNLAIAMAVRKPLRYGVLAFWLIMTIICGGYAPYLLTATSQEFTPPSSSDAAKATDMLMVSFPPIAKTTPFLLYLQVGKVNNATSIAECTQAWKFNEALSQKLEHEPNVLANVSFFQSVSMGIPKEILGQFKPDSNGTIIQLIFSGYMTDTHTSDFLETLEGIIDSISPPKETLEVFLLGSPLIIREATNSAMSDLERMDMIVLPLAFLVFGALLKSWRLMLIPFCTLVASLACSFGVVTWVAWATPIYTMTPSLMMSILIAMAIDYALFILTRYTEGLEKGATVEQAVVEAMETAGMTITISGVTLQLSFLALLFFPITVISSLGLGCALALVITLVVNLTLVPALILTFPGFFGVTESCFTSCCGTKKDPAPPIDQPYMMTSADFSISHNYDPNEMEGCWGKLAKCTTTTWVAVLIVLGMSALTTPFFMKFLQLETTDAWTVAIPRGSPVNAAFDKVADNFGQGYMSPYTILLKPRYCSVMNESFFDDATSLINAVVANASLYDTRADDFVSGFYNNGTSLYPYVSYCLGQSPPSGICIGLLFNLQSTFNVSTNSVIVRLTLRWDPLNDNGADWLDSARKGFKQYGDQYNIDVWIQGVGADSMDAIRAVYDLLPVMIGATGGVVLLIVAVAFKSLVVPLRTIFTIGMTLLWAYGFAVYCYQDGVLDWTGIAGFAKQGAEEWMVPVLSFPILVGISLDYDIFLITRVAELRMMGFTNTECIRLGVVKTGHIITTAGLIMAIAFSGLLFSSLPSCNQLSFYMVFAVVFDTFVVRSFLVPSLMHLLGDFNWWPRSVPK